MILDSIDFKPFLQLVLVVVFISSLVTFTANPVRAQKLVTLLHSFSTGAVANDGQNPTTTLIQNSSGDFFGTADGGGTSDNGVVYEMTPSGNVTIIHSFADTTTDGGTPSGGLTMGSNGTIYGTTEYGGTYGQGTVYQVTSAGVYSVLYSFGLVGLGDADNPVSPPILYTDGYLYGVSQFGGSFGNGAFYRLLPGSLTDSVPYSFGKTSNDGVVPESALAVGPNNNFFTTTAYGGTGQAGAVVELSTSGGESVVYSFQGDTVNETDGNEPCGGLVLAPDGNFYGMTEYGGTENQGVVYRVNLSSKTDTVIHTFGTSSGDGSYPAGGLAVGADGNLYGITNGGGTEFDGTIFSITAGGAISILHSFDDGSVTDDGYFPSGGLVLGSNDSLYGTTQDGGLAFCGTVFSLNVTPPPTISPDGGAYQSDQLVTISDPQAGATIYYTTNGSPATTSSSKYLSPLLVPVSTTINAIAQYGSYLTLPSVSASFLIDQPVPTPVINPNGGPITGPQTVTISDVLPGTSLYYSVNGTSQPVESSEYTAPITVSASETITAVGVANGYSISAPALATFTLLKPTPAPTISPNGGAVSSGQTITLTDSVAGPSFYYSTNGTSPTVNSTPYTGPITVTSSETIEAIALAAGYSVSSPTKVSFTVETPVPTPVIIPGGGFFTGPQAVTLSDSLGKSAKIYYALNGTATPQSTLYSGPIIFSSSGTISVVATASGYLTSAPAMATFTFASAVPTPTITPKGGAVPAGQKVTIADSQAGATIYYAITGSSASSPSTIYTAPITVTSAETITAIAVLTGDTNSAAATASFTIVPAPTITSFTPSSGPVGTVVKIIGTNFTGTTLVTFTGSAAAVPTVVTATSITVGVPANAKTGTLSVTAPGGIAISTGTFTVIPAPTITSFTPATGPVGTKITITGTNLTGATLVTFTGKETAVPTVTSSTSATVVVQTSATTGTFTITTPGGTATSPSAFTVTVPAKIISFTPMSGRVGTKVTITGTNLGDVESVTFGAGKSDVQALPVDRTTTTVVTIVPEGAKTGQISVKTPTGTATSSQKFTVVSLDEPISGE